MTAHTPRLPVAIDYTKCRGHARCLAIAPDAFDYDDENEVAIVLPGAADADPAELERAIQSCPEQAISKRTGGT